MAVVYIERESQFMIIDSHRVIDSLSKSCTFCWHWVEKERNRLPHQSPPEEQSSPDPMVRQSPPGCVLKCWFSSNPGTLLISGEHQNSWDLWMFIPFRSWWFIGFDPSPFINRAQKSLRTSSTVTTDGCHVDICVSYCPMKVKIQVLLIRNKDATNRWLDNSP
jgi:hypothetical protein